jgi:hypothetical protein
MREAIQNLVALGPMPASDDPSVKSWLALAEPALRALTRPLTNDEARALATLFGPDDCFGAAWTVLHLVETAPDWPLQDVLGMPSNEWTDRLGQRVANAKQSL